MENHIEVQEQQDKGFTLVELLIVIVILGILATVTVFAVRGITDQGKTSTCKADAKTLETAYEAYVAQYGGSSIPVTTAVGAAAAVAAAAGPPIVYATPAEPAYAAVGAGAVPPDHIASYTVVGTDAETTLINAGFTRTVSPNWVMSPGGVLRVQLVAGASANGCDGSMI